MLISERTFRLDRVGIGNVAGNDRVCESLASLSPDSPPATFGLDQF